MKMQKCVSMNRPPYIQKPPKLTLLKANNSDPCCKGNNFAGAQLLLSMLSMPGFGWMS